MMREWVVASERAPDGQDRVAAVAEGVPGAAIEPVAWTCADAVWTAGRVVAWVLHTRAVIDPVDRAARLGLAACPPAATWWTTVIGLREDHAGDVATALATRLGGRVLDAEDGTADLDLDLLVAPPWAPTSDRPPRGRLLPPPPDAPVDGMLEGSPRIAVCGLASRTLVGDGLVGLVHAWARATATHVIVCGTPRSAAAPEAVERLQSPAVRWVVQGEHGWYEPLADAYVRVLDDEVWHGPGRVSAPHLPENRSVVEITATTHHPHPLATPPGAVAATALDALGLPPLSRWGELDRDEARLGPERAELVAAADRPGAVWWAAAGRHGEPGADLDGCLRPGFAARRGLLRAVPRRVVREDEHLVADLRADWGPDDCGELALRCLDAGARRVRVTVSGRLPGRLVGASGTRSDAPLSGRSVLAVDPASYPGLKAERLVTLGGPGSRVTGQRPRVLLVLPPQRWTDLDRIDAMLHRHDAFVAD